ncbi:hypothetical protein GN958_ATG19629 [Phytophthora infestans]|uniref:Uncharacterized protein n=1 Tax=Phytophthora infestans TaxID=4787 RepID=A0A8S9TX66_PHYIN|nr:hypothetical protein GN958_ATG19629 [Phytophthora infestans]
MDQEDELDAHRGQGVGRTPAMDLVLSGRRAKGSAREAKDRNRYYRSSHSASNLLPSGESDTCKEKNRYYDHGTEQMAPVGNRTWGCPTLKKRPEQESDTAIIIFTKDEVEGGGGHGEPHIPDVRGKGIPVLYLV